MSRRYNEQRRRERKPDRRPERKPVEEPPLSGLRRFLQPSTAATGEPVRFGTVVEARR
jgi:hypothetical protein